MIKWIKNPMQGAAGETMPAEDGRTTDPAAGFSYDETGLVRRLQESLDTYAVTPLVHLKGLAAAGGIRAAFVKDESHRFGLKAFKGLGGIYAMYQMIMKRFGLDPETAPPDILFEEKYREKIRDLVFITTTDGNHGKGVSWAAGLFGASAHVFMPKGSAEVRAQAIRDAGNADVVITDMTYDDCVAYTADLAEKNGWLLIQDTAWDGYEDVPHWIMQGYTTMLFEAMDQMKEAGYDRPTHIFLQAGVGAMAGGVAAAAVRTWPEAIPMILTVEPTEVACFYESIEQADGKPHMATGSFETIMAGLNCAAPCTLAWDVMRGYTAYAFSCGDDVTEHGMRLLGRSPYGDPAVISGESGAVTTGLLDKLLQEAQYAPLRKAMGLDENAVVLLISTEGDTDPEDYERVLSAS